MWPTTAEVVQDVRVGTGGLLQGIGQHGEAGRVESSLGEDALAVGEVGEVDGRAALTCQERRVNRPGGAEGVADDVAEEVGLPVPPDVSRSLGSHPGGVFGATPPREQDGTPRGPGGVRGPPASAPGGCLDRYAGGGQLGGARL